MNGEPSSTDPEPAVDSDAVELPAGPAPLKVEQAPAYANPPAPSANPIVDVSSAPGATAPSFDGHAAEPPADPLESVKVLAAERPELAVGAAFAGGIIAAMILRRLGN